jgi:hypothetical protein
MNYPFELHRVPGTEAIGKLQELRAQRRGVPLILGDEATFERIAENMELNSNTSTEQFLESAKRIDPIKWLNDREAEDFDYYAIDAGPWPEGDSSNNSLSAHRDVLTRKPHAEVLLTVLPAEESWMAPCYLRIGNWNSVPTADAHAALFKYWHEHCGATVACIADDVIEFTVDKPPRTKDEALVLAKQHYIYCADIVHQGVGTVEGLAAALLNASVWYFWWD